MDIFFSLIALFAVFAVFGALAVRYGVDSRIDSTDPRRSPYPVGIEF
ncbi:MAG: hypothetical protein ACJ779_07705 [Chloroflexota bacterium]